MFSHSVGCLLTVNRIQCCVEDFFSIMQYYLSNLPITFSATGILFMKPLPISTTSSYPRFPNLETITQNKIIIEPHVDAENQTSVLFKHSNFS